MKVYILFSQEYIDFTYGYDNQVVAVYKNKDDAVKECDRLLKLTTGNYYVEPCEVEE